MATWREAVQPVPHGVRLLLEVTPSARASQFPAGFNPWRGRIGLRVRAPAQEGRANQEALATVAAFFGVPTSGVLLESGGADGRKAFLLKARVEDVLRRLAAALEAEERA